MSDSPSASKRHNGCAAPTYVAHQQPSRSLVLLQSPMYLYYMTFLHCPLDAERASAFRCCHSEGHI
jgi:hypothetical protein